MYDRLKKTIRTYRKNRDGTTLVELIVTFALIGLFMTAAMGMLTTSLQMFGRMQASSNAITVSDLLLDKIAGEIAAADIPESNSTSGYYFWLEPESAAPDGKSRWIAFRNRSKSPIAIFAADHTAAGKGDSDDLGRGQLFIRYYAVAEANQKAAEEIDWHYDSKVYMDYTIQDLWFTREEPQSHPNVIKINLILKNERTGFTYESFRYTESYNYDFNSNYMCERTQIAEELEAGRTKLPVEAEEFQIRLVSGGDGDNGGDGEGNGGSAGDDNPQETYFTVYYVSDRTGAILDTKVYPDIKFGDSFSLEAQYIAGYNLVGNWWLPMTYDENNTSYTYHYEPKERSYEIKHLDENGNDEKFKEYNKTGVIYTDQTIEYEAPHLYGYIPEKEDYQYQFTAIGDNAEVFQFLVRYRRSTENDSFSVQGNNVQVKVDGLADAPWAWTDFANNIRSFFEPDEWEQVEYRSDDDVYWGYCKEFKFRGTSYAISGWIETSGNSAKESDLKRAVADLFKQVDRDDVFVISKREDDDRVFTNSTAKKTLFRYIMSQTNSMANGQWLGVIDSVTFDEDSFQFNGTHLSSVTFKVEANWAYGDTSRRTVTITFD